MYENDPAIASELASVMAVPVTDVTHCVRVGTRDGIPVYAVGWWTKYSYQTAVVSHDGTRFGEMNLTYDMGVAR